MACCSFIGVAMRVAQKLGKMSTHYSQYEKSKELILAGLHKDPSNFSKLSAVETCIRRQLWWTLVSLDVQVAYSSGLPPVISFEYSDVLQITELAEDLASESFHICASRTDSTGADRLLLRVFAAAKFEFYRRSRDLLHSLHNDSLREADVDEIIKITRNIREILDSKKAQIEAVHTVDQADLMSAESTTLTTDTFAQFARSVLSMLATKPFSVMYGPLRRAGLLHVLRDRVRK